MSVRLNPYPEYQKDVQLCRRVHQRHGKSFYLGSLLLPQDQKEACWILYAFFRYPDEIVDVEYKSNSAEASKQLEEWTKKWKDIRSGILPNTTHNEESILRAANFIFTEYTIPDEYAASFLQAMKQDTYKSRYETYKDLEIYMYGSASVVGLMMSYVMCKKVLAFEQNMLFKKNVLDGAKSLGEALQLTNFLRDIGEDVRDRERIYMPQEDMKKFFLTDEDFIKQKNSHQFKELMRFEIARTRNLYDKGNEAITLLPKESRKAIKVASVVYSRILKKIEQNKYDVFTKRVRVGTVEKIFFLLYVILSDI